MGRAESSVWNPSRPSTRAASAAKRAARNRVSNPTSTRSPARPSSASTPAMAATTRRALANVKSSAMTARQPEVPNVIAVKRERPLFSRRRREEPIGSATFSSCEDS